MDVSNAKPGRGRPKSERTASGEISKKGEFLVHAVVVLAAVEKGRAEGKTLRSAIEWAVADLKAQFPSEKFSLSGVKRILREFQPTELMRAKLPVGRGKATKAGEYEMTISERPATPKVKKKTIRFGRGKNKD